MDRINELLGRLADLSDAEVAELEGLVLTEFDASEAEEELSQATVERMVSLADAMEKVRGELSRRTEEAAILAQQAKDAAARVRGGTEAKAEEASSLAEADEEEEVPPAAAEAVEPVPTEEDVQADIDQVAEDIVQAEEDVAAAEEDEEKRRAAGLSTTSEQVQELSADAGETTHQEDAVTASLESGAGVVVTPPSAAAPVPTNERGPNQLALTITAGGDIPGYTTGSQLSNMDTVADAFAKRLHALRNVQSGSVQQTIATLSYEFPEDRRLVGDDPRNISRINAVTSPAALTAAAGICAPLETIYDVNVCGDDSRPIRDALARFNADRGGIKIYGTPTLGAGGSGIWDPKNPGAKTCADASCPTPQEIGLEAVYACMKFSNYTNRFFPEVVKANTDLALIHHARMADLNLLQQIRALSTAIDFNTAKTGMLAPTTAGVTRAVLVALDNSAAYLRRLHRLAVNAPMRIILPSWLGDAMAADLALQMPTSGDGLDAMNIADSKIEALFRNRGYNVTWSLDSWDDDGNAEDVNIGRGGFDADVWFPIFPEGAFLFLDGGTLDLGVQRDMSMVTSNEYATFVETFEGVALTGCSALWAHVPVCVSGAAAALADTSCA
jgi:hypothetical protein